ncbi:hypothetical protein FHS29_003094 [Saccharothrix tamanrassetensis]|uniref:Uncharacterized protein n=1 Tax=Saccharothrix tamanrassetensis TaxID=1051531 RepID=A0A841CK11_9PSEU|nr:hypothetical protein [Saccharothrix tamanrassetensis]MBB5956508.1 hypothetical protein [Saccharothrix tamanrassetensis]
MTAIDEMVAATAPTTFAVVDDDAEAREAPIVAWVVAFEERAQALAPNGELLLHTTDEHTALAFFNRVDAMDGRLVRAR